MATYLVGGAVRDLKLGIKPKDNDYVVVGSTQEEMLELGFKQVGKDFPVFLHPATSDEWALARTERSTGNGYGDFSFSTENVSIEDDLKRRDFTINAMAIPTFDMSQIIDPYDGLRDIEHKLIRHTSDAFSEDPLRVLRCARFLARYHSKGFTVASETFDLCKQMVSDKMLLGIAKDRIWKETEKALQEPNPEMYFKFLKEVGFSYVDSYQLLSLKATAKLHDDPVVRYASFTDDFLDADYHPPNVYKKCGQMVHDITRYGVSLEDPEWMMNVLKKYRAWNNRHFLTALKALNNPIIETVYAELTSITRDVKVDVPEGPEYGRELSRQRLYIVRDYLQDLM